MENAQIVAPVALDRRDGIAGLAVAPKLDIYAMALDSLRGRYVLAIVLAALGAAAGMWFGWKSGKVVYQSEGLVRIAYSKEPIESETDQNQPLRMFDAWMRSETLLIKGRPMLEAALKSELWQSSVAQVSVESISEGLQVDRPNGTDLLRISFADERPLVAATAVQSVIQVYQSDYRERELERDRKRDKLLEERETELGKKLLEAEALLVKENASELELELSEANQQVAYYQVEIAKVNVGMAFARGKGTPVDAIRLLSDERLAELDTKFEALLSERGQIQREINTMVDEGMLEKNQQLERKRKSLARVDGELRQRRDRFEQEQAAAPADDGKNRQIVSQFVASPGELEERERRLRQLYTVERGKLSHLLKRRDDLKKLNEQAAVVRVDLKQISERRQKLQLESRTGGRLMVLSPGDIPMKSFRDGRKKLAMMGAAAGAAVPLGLMLSFGVLRRRYRFADEPVAPLGNSSALLGTVPRLPAAGFTEHEATDVAQSLHRIRLMLDARRCKTGGKSFLVTSASAGEGKTSVALALAFSYSVAGVRTLLIDADMVGRTITRGLDGGGLPGLSEALATGRLVVKEGSHGLGILMAGATSASDASRISSASAARLLKEARKQFDLILVDSGPILGSIEASAIAPAVDGIVLVIARGQRPELVDQSLNTIRSLGGEVTGFVFNRARMRDFYQSFQSSSLRDEEAHESHRRRTVRMKARSRFGPLVESVAAFTPVTESSV